MRSVAMNISVTVMLAASEVSFTMPISELDSGGKAVRSAWGSTMRRMDCAQLRPAHSAASSWPTGTDSSAARMVSAQ